MVGALSSMPDKSKEEKWDKNKEQYIAYIGSVNLRIYLPLPVINNKFILVYCIIDIETKNCIQLCT